MTRSLLKIVLQWTIIGLTVVFLGYFADSPRHQYMADGQAQIKLGFMHVGARVEECRRRSPEELAALPQHMRRPLDCARERVSVVVEVEVNGEILYHRSLQPTGLRHDGPARVYAIFHVPAGEHRIAARIRDTAREAGYDHERLETVTLVSGQNLVIDFSKEKGGITFR